MSIGMNGAGGGRNSRSQKGNASRGNASSGARSRARGKTKSARARTKVEEEFDEDEDDDEVELPVSKKKKSGVDVRTLAVAGLGVAVIGVAGYLFLSGGSSGDEVVASEAGASEAGASEEGYDSGETEVGASEVGASETLEDVQDGIEDAVEDAQPDVVTDVDGNAVYDSEGNVIGNDAIDPGYITSTDNEADGSVPAQVFDADDYILDLNGVAVSGQYNVESIDYVYDYVEYEIKRAIIDSGMEMYWAEIEYEGKKYRSQMTYDRASKFKEKGIATAEMEVLSIVGGGKVISWMRLEPEE